MTAPAACSSSSTLSKKTFSGCSHSRRGSRPTVGAAVSREECRKPIHSPETSCKSSSTDDNMTDSSESSSHLFENPYLYHVDKSLQKHHNDNSQDEIGDKDTGFGYESAPEESRRSRASKRRDSIRGNRKDATSRSDRGSVSNKDIDVYGYENTDEDSVRGKCKGEMKGSRRAKTVKKTHSPSHSIQRRRSIATSTNVGQEIDRHRSARNGDDRRESKKNSSGERHPAATERNKLGYEDLRLSVDSEGESHHPTPSKKSRCKSEIARRGQSSKTSDRIVSKVETSSKRQVSRTKPSVPRENKYQPPCQHSLSDDDVTKRPVTRRHSRSRRASIGESTRRRSRRELAGREESVQRRRSSLSSSSASSDEDRSRPHRKRRSSMNETSRQQCTANMDSLTTSSTHKIMQRSASITACRTAPNIDYGYEDTHPDTYRAGCTESTGQHQKKSDKADKSGVRRTRSTTEASLASAATERIRRFSFSSATTPPAPKDNLLCISNHERSSKVGFFSRKNHQTSLSMRNVVAAEEHSAISLLGDDRCRRRGSMLERFG